MIGRTTLVFLFVLAAACSSTKAETGTSVPTSGPPTSGTSATTGLPESDPSVAPIGSTGSIPEFSDYEDCLDALGAGTMAGTCHAMRLDQLDAEIDLAVLERRARLDEIAADDTAAADVRQAAATARSDLPDAVSAFRALRERTCWDLLGPPSMPLAVDANTGRCEVALTESYLDTIS